MLVETVYLGADRGAIMHDEYLVIRPAGWKSDIETFHGIGAPLRQKRNGVLPISGCGF